MGKKFAAIYSIVVGLSMIAMWIVFYTVWSIPELATEPARILLHIAAELITAVALVLGGWGLLTERAWGYQVYLLSTGALLYTMIQSPGYFLQAGDVGFVGMFAVLLITALSLLIKVLKNDGCSGTLSERSSMKE
jgi:hypothetical protein